MLGLRKVSGGDLGVALALGDQGQDLGFPVGQPLAPAGPVQAAGAAGPGRWVADDDLAGVHGLQRGDQIAGRQRLRQVAVHPLPAGALGPDRGGSSRCRPPLGGRAGCSIRTLISSWSDSGCAKESYSTMSTVSLERLVGVDLGDDDPVPVLVEHLGHAEHDDVVVVDQRHGDRAC